MTSLFSLTGGEVLKCELRQLESALRGEQKNALGLVGAADRYSCCEFQSYALAAATRRCQKCVAGIEAPR